MLGRLMILQVHSLPMDSLAHPQDIISVHALGMGCRDKSCGIIWPNVHSQPTSVIWGKTGVSVSTCVQGLLCNDFS